MVFYPLILLLYPGSVRIIFTDPDPKARDPPDPDPHHWLQSFDELRPKKSSI